MARYLLKRQKKLLDAWYEENRNLSGLAVFDYIECDEFTEELFIELTHINNYETLWQDINRYINDKASDDNRSRSFP